MSLIPNLLINTFITGSLYALIALGFNLIYGTTHFFNMAHGAVAMIAGYVVLYLVKTMGMAMVPSVMIGVLMAGAVGYLADRVVFRRLRTKQGSGTIFMVASLGLATVFQAIISILFSSRFQMLSAENDFTVYHFFGGVITPIQVVILISVACIATALAFLLKSTRFGASVRAVSDDVQVAKIVGLDTDRIIGRVFFLGSAIAGIGGILVGFDSGLEPTMGLSLFFKGAIASIIGGAGNVFGGIFGAFLLAFIESFGIWKISGEWKDALSFGVLILFLFFRPKGVFAH